MLDKIRKMDRKTIEKRVETLRFEIINKHIEISSGKEKASSKLRTLKKELARLLTFRTRNKGVKPKKVEQIKNNEKNNKQKDG